MIAEQADLIEIALTVNGTNVAARVPPCTTLQGMLHEYLGCTEVKLGCGEGVCGACAVLLEGAPSASCLKLALQAQGQRVTTVAGLERLEGSGGALFQSLRNQFVARESFQCGYCAPGLMTSATHYLTESNDADPAEIRRALASHICRCTGYSPIVEAVAATARREAPPDPDPRLDLREKIDGVAVYPTDGRADEALAGCVLWSEHPSARIARIDIDDALAAPGVVAVLTHRDIPGRNISGLTLFADDQPLLAAERVRSRGDAVAMVAARTPAQARNAIRKIRVSYERLPTILDALDALRPEAPQLGRHGNVIAQFTHLEGDPVKAFREATVVVEGTYRCEVNDHACMEPEGGFGFLEGDTLVVVAPSLTPHVSRSVIASTLGLPERRVRIDTPRMGGSFGKYLVPGVEPLIALFVWKTRQSVRLVLDRTEILARRAKRHPLWARYRLGLGEDGRFLALDADVIADAGPYVSLTPTVVSVFADEVTGAYAIPNLKILARGVLTNNLPAAPMRGFGSQQINFGIESILEKAARAMGVDSCELRRKNYVTARKDGLGREIHNPAIALPETLARVVARLGDRPAAPAGWLTGRGLASIKCKYGYPYGMVDRFVVRVAVDQAGQFSVESDIPDSGTGIVTGMARLVRQELGLAALPRAELAQRLIQDPSGDWLARGKAPSRVRSCLFRMIERLQGVQATQAVLLSAALSPGLEAWFLKILAAPFNALNGMVNWLKGRLFPFGLDSYVPRTSGSRGMLMAGRAAISAAVRFRDHAMTLAARALDLPPADLEQTTDGIRLIRDHRKTLTWGELARYAGGSLAALGESHLPAGGILESATGNQTGAVDHMFTTHGCDVAVDPETGEVRILRYVACQDVGRLLHPRVVAGQVSGAVTMGIGQAIFERLHLEQGIALNATFHDYRVPTMLDAPDVTIDLIESGDGMGPFGAKGVGEAGAVASPIVIAHALYDALGKQPTEIPTTPEMLIEL